MKQVLSIQRGQIQKVIKFAEQNIYDIDDLLDFKNGQKTAPGDISGHVTILGDFRAVFSLEDHPGGRMRHLSISVKGTAKDWPSIWATKVIMTQFGFVTDIEKKEKSPQKAFVIRCEEAKGKVKNHINIFESCQ